MPYYYFDYYYFILIIPALLLGLYAQIRVKSAFSRYNRIYARSGLTGMQVARRILDENGLYDIPVQFVSGSLTDHYDPRSRVLRLSESVYHSNSIAAAGIAAHEVGHAIQHATGYGPLKIRSAIVPVTQIGSTLAIPLILVGLLFFEPFIMVGIILYATVAVFQLITLPVEFNASSRAMATLQRDGMLVGDELTGAKRVLSAAALTYVAALVASLAQLLRLFLLYGRRRGD